MNTYEINIEFLIMIRNMLENIHKRTTFERIPIMYFRLLVYVCIYVNLNLKIVLSSEKSKTKSKSRQTELRQ